MAEQRKLIRLGNSSFAIALPKDWVEKSGLKKGDNIFIEKNSGGELIIQSKYRKANGEKKIEIDVEGKERETIKKELAAAYVHGYDAITFKGKKDKIRRYIIKKLLDNLLSFELVGENDKELISKDFFNLEDVNLDNFIKRIDNNIREILDIIKQRIKEGKLTRKDISEIGHAEKDINKFYLLASRLFIKGIDNPAVLNALKKDTLSLFNYWWLAFNLEHTGDTLKDIANFIVDEQINKKNLEEIHRLFSKIIDNYVKAIDSSYKLNKEMALEAMNEGPELLKECEKLSLSKDSIVAKLGVKFKEIQYDSYQNSKMILYMKY
ncbi:MAG TPA: hypothetical protein VMZ91_10575 [Candidatus Paceibacterota bacterium]|nr:hypothetical protein [Candidatus Paceibacterota bacterium]